MNMSKNTKRKNAQNNIFPLTAVVPQMRQLAYIEAVRYCNMSI